MGGSVDRVHHLANAEAILAEADAEVLWKLLDFFKTEYKSFWWDSLREAPK